MLHFRPSLPSTTGGQACPVGTDEPLGELMSVTFTLNAKTVQVGEDHPHLLSALREELLVTSPKDGCSPSGQCGACTVLMDGKATVACLVSLASVAGRSVTTLEGLPAQEVNRLASAFADSGALQCGFCTPGILLRTKYLLDKKGASLTREDAARHLGAHLCRCTGYVKILDAVELLARQAAGGSSSEPFQPARRLGASVGDRGARYQGRELAVGSRGYVDDIVVPGMLHAALRMSDHARAIVTAIDTKPAEQVEGVVAVLTAKDIPGDSRVGIIDRDWPVLIPVGASTSYIGDVLAVVVAKDRITARKAAALVSVDYEVLQPVTDPIAAMSSSEDAVWGIAGNILSTSRYARGDVDAALASSDHVVHELFRTQRVEHAFLEPESTLAVPFRSGGLHVYSGGQGIFDDRDQIAAVLGIPAEKVVVELVSNGGAFGGKEDLSNQAHAALAAYLLQVPVRCTLSRTESLLMHPKRHPMQLEYWAGCDGEGRLSALRARIVGDSGPYASVGAKVLERAAGHASGPYEVGSIDVESVAVRTNNPVCGAFRGFGSNQAQFAMEGVMDRLAAKVGISGLEMRRRNVVRPSSIWGPGQVLDDGALGAAECLAKVAPVYEEARAAGMAVGLGMGIKNSGLGNGAVEVSRAVVILGEDGSVEVRHGWTEMGQGVNTVVLQVAAQELGVDPERVKVMVDTTRELGDGQTTGSRATVMVAGAVSDACKVALAGGLHPGIDYLGEYRVDWTNSIEEGLEHPVVHSTFSYAAQVVIIDRATGRIEKVVAAHDVGKAVNPLQVEGQIEGAVHMGLGFALSEEFPVDEEGRPTHMTLRSLGILRAKDVPRIEVHIVECPQPRSPYGVKGVGEIGLVPTAGAVAAALHELDGAWRDRLPMAGDQAGDQAGNI
ncbi:MAG: selenium-dependent xanthine dehydrogenase [Acidimicrobiales bacterium]